MKTIPTLAIILMASLIIGSGLVLAQSGDEPILQRDAEQVPLGAFPHAIPIPRSLELVGAFIEGKNIHDLGPINNEEVEAADRAANEKYENVRPGPIRVGLVRQMEIPLTLTVAHADDREYEGNQRIWTLAIRSPGAYGMRLHFSTFDVGDGSVLIYSSGDAEQVVLGPFTGQEATSASNFWTASLPGDIVYIEGVGPNVFNVVIDQIVHFDKSPSGASGFEASSSATSTLPILVTRPTAESTSSTPLPPAIPLDTQATCDLDVRCTSFGGLHPATRDATGQMNFVSGGGAFVCTGTILNDLDGATYMPYFITAFHCLNTQQEVDSLEVVFFWQRDSCGGSLPNYFTLSRRVGGVLLATNPTNGGNDMTFVRLNGTLPGGVWQAGWSTGSLPDHMVGVHHPGGSWKRAVLLGNEGVINGCTGLPPDRYHHLRMDDGWTYPGSSGSGVFDSAARLLGQLYGVCYSGNGNCPDRDNVYAVYGGFNVTYPRIRRWMEIGGTINVDGNYNGSESGTPSQPYDTVAEAYNLSWNGSRIKIKPGSYPETFTLIRNITLFSSGGTVTIGD